MYKPPLKKSKRKQEETDLESEAKTLPKIDVEPANVKPKAKLNLRRAGGGLSPGYSGKAGMSPAYGGSGSPSYGAPSPLYVMASPSRANLHDLGGVLTSTVMQMVKELSPHEHIHTELISANMSDTLEVVLTKMCSKNCLSLPVADTEGAYCDIIDVFDILRAVVGGFNAEEVRRSRDLKADSEKTWHELSLKGKKVLTEHNVRNLLEERHAKGDAVATTKVRMTSSVSNLLQIYVRQRTHRVVILSDIGNVMSLVSQTDLLKYLYNKASIVKAASKTVNLTLEDLGLHKRRVLVVNKDAPVLYALYKMNVYSSMAIAVVNDDNKLVRHFSASDLRGLKPELFGTLVTPVSLFGTPRKLVTFTKDQTLWDVIATFVGKKLHRACIVDENGVPYGQVSITNLLEALVKPIGT
eukprot:TRINITY_DN14665_c0_g1_i1.p1 TRINITY_DN14665_c0_g1~~TRINITY_DN14665_c0_g1_i1.p1  ORF type:complete len:428 (+),score=68.60 TRINITY_DN14665_c0_g1_i1:53-1285(+)